MGLAFYSSTANIRDAINKLNRLHGTNSNSISGIIHGNGSTSGNDTIEKAVQWAVNIANDNSHGYNQYDTREGHEDHGRQGPDYDCSSLVSNAWAEAGVGVSRDDATYTMMDDYLANGFTWHAGNPAASELQRGDVLLNIQNHTAMYLGDNLIVEAYINEFGDICNGEIGDQTGEEIHTTQFYSFPWDGYLRYGE